MSRLYPINFLLLILVGCGGGESSGSASPVSTSRSVFESVSNKSVNELNTTSQELISQNYSGETAPWAVNTTDAAEVALLILDEVADLSGLVSSFNSQEAITYQSSQPSMKK